MSIPMYYCTAIDDRHLPLLLNLIGSIHKFHFDQLEEIMVYDLGLSKESKEKLENIQKLNIYEIEKLNPQILEDLQTDEHRHVKGLFSWKPVVVKDALDKVPYVLYLDSGTTLLKPIDILFKHIIQNGYLLFDCGHSIKWMTTKYIIDKFNLESDENKWILNDNTFGIDAGFQGMSRSVYDNYIMPMYELCKDIKNFVDDKTCPNGWGCGRHDQTLYSILARKLNLHIENHDVEGCSLNVDAQKVPFDITHTPHKVTDKTYIFRSRWTLPSQFTDHNISMIRMKQEPNNILLEKAKNDFQKFSKEWVNSKDYNAKIYSYFKDQVNFYPFLNDHNEIVTKYNLGYGEKAFRYLWFLVLSQIPKNGKFLEIGVFKGSILALSQVVSKQFNLNITSFGITPLNNTGDKYSNYINEDYEKSILFLYQQLGLDLFNTKIMHGLSTDESVKHLAKEHGLYDIVYIDGGHDYETVVNDIELTNKILKKDGLLIMDDASSFLEFNHNHEGFTGHKDVAQAIKDKIDVGDTYIHLFACGHNRVWRKIK